MSKERKRKELESQLILEHLQDKIICNHYQLTKYVDSGTYCFVFEASKIQPLTNQNNNTNIIQTQKQPSYAIKIEKKRGLIQSFLTLQREAQVLKSLQNQRGFPILYAYQQTKEYNFMVTTYLGNNIKSLFLQKNKKFSIQTVSLIACQVISRLQVMHEKGYIHRDLKPANLLIGNTPETEGVIHMIDYGLSNKYIKQDGSHLEFRKDRGVIGTAKYMSVHAHLGYELSRRDDLESLGYILIYLAKGSLPWGNITGTTQDEINEKIALKKGNLTFDKFCKGLPNAYMKYMQYVMKLEFYEQPNYKYLKNLFRISVMSQSTISQMTGHTQLQFDWQNTTENSSQMKNQISSFSQISIPNTQSQFSSQYSKLGVFCQSQESVKFNQFKLNHTLSIHGQKQKKYQVLLNLSIANKLQETQKEEIDKVTNITTYNITDDEEDENSSPANKENFKKQDKTFQNTKTITNKATFEEDNDSVNSQIESNNKKSKQDKSFQRFSTFQTDQNQSKNLQSEYKNDQLKKQKSIKNKNDKNEKRSNYLSILTTQQKRNQFIRGKSSQLEQIKEDKKEYEVQKTSNSMRDISLGPDQVNESFDSDSQNKKKQYSKNKTIGNVLSKQIQKQLKRSQTTLNLEVKLQKHFEQRKSIVIKDLNIDENTINCLQNMSNNTSIITGSQNKNNSKTDNQNQSIGGSKFRNSDIQIKLLQQNFSNQNLDKIDNKQVNEAFQTTQGNEQEIDLTNSSSNNNVSVKIDNELDIEEKNKNDYKYNNNKNKKNKKYNQTHINDCELIYEDDENHEQTFKQQINESCTTLRSSNNLKNSKLSKFGANLSNSQISNQSYTHSFSNNQKFKLDTIQSTNYNQYQIQNLNMQIQNLNEFNYNVKKINKLKY